MVEYRINTKLFREISNPLILKYSHNNLINILKKLKKTEKEGKLLTLYEKYMFKEGNINYSTNLVIPYMDNFSNKEKKVLRELVIINNPQDAERLANSNIKKVGNLKPFVFNSIISTTNNENWKDQRRDYQEAFSVKNVLEDLISISNSRAIECVNTLWDLSFEGRKEVNINEFFLNETHAQLQLAMFGFSKDFESSNNKKIREMFYNTDLKEGKTIVKKLVCEIDKSKGPISQVINERKQNNSGKNNSCKNRSDKKRSEEVGNALIFSYAGHDTTGNTLTWLIYELSKNKEYQSILQEEVDNFWKYQCGRDIKYKDFKRLPFMTRCIMETLRLWPALANGTFRELDKDEYIIGNNSDNKVKLPKGTYIQIPNWFRHRNPELWGQDVNIFNPLREFLDEELWDNTIINTYNPSTERFSPFTYGPRDCIGKNFSQIEMRIILLHLFKNYSFELTEDQKNYSMEDIVCNKFTMGPRNIYNKDLSCNKLGMYVYIRKRYINGKSKL